MGLEHEPAWQNPNHRFTANLMALKVTELNTGKDRRLSKGEECFKSVPGRAVLKPAVHGRAVDWQTFHDAPTTSKSCGDYCQHLKHCQKKTNIYIPFTLSTSLSFSLALSFLPFLYFPNMHPSLSRKIRHRFILPRWRYQQTLQQGIILMYTQATDRARIAIETTQ